MQLPRADGRWSRPRLLGRTAAVAAAVVAVLVSLLTPFDRPAEAQQTYPFACNGGGVVTRGAWTVMPIPAFQDGAGGQQARHHAVAADRPSTIVVTNGTSVLRTTDGGCGWDPVLDLPPTPTGSIPFSRDTAQIVDVAIPRGGGDRIYLVVMEAGRVGEGLPDVEGTNPVIPHIVASFDGGQSWATYDSGLQPIARDAGDGSTGYCGQVSGCMLEFSSTNRDVGYLALSVSDGAPGVLYATGSGARGGWEPRSVPGDAADPEPAQGIEQLAVDPVDANRVWIDNGGLAVSNDAGASWLGVDDGTDGFRVALDVALDHGERRTLVLASGQRSVPAPVDHAAIGTGSGMQPVPGAMGLAGVRIDSADHGADASQLVAAGPDGVYALDGAFARVDEQLVSSYGPARDVQGVVHPEVEAYVMLGTGAVLVYHPTEPPPPPEPELPPLEVPPPPDPEPISLSPHGAQVEVDPGTSETVAYELDLPAQPIPVDVFFLLDSSTSMGPLIQGLTRGLDGLIRNLVRARLDVHFGLAEFQDSRDTGGVRYRLRRQLTRPDAAFQHSLATMKELGGHEPHLTALDQMVTGSGIPNPMRGRSVEPGMGAAWREGSLRIAVLASNEPYGTPPDAQEYCYQTNYEDPEAPPEATVMQRLRDDGVQLVGVEYLYDQREDPKRNGIEADLCMATHPGGTSPLRAQMNRWTQATGSVAPRGGIDCNSDGDIDLHEGDPLVCSLPKSQASGVVELEDALVRMILSVRRPRPVEVTAASEGGATVSVQPASDFSAVDVRSDHLLGFTTTFSCNADQAGRQLRVTLTATLAGEPVARAPATVVCGPQPAEDVPPPEVPQPGAPAPPPPAAPPALAGPPPAPAPVAAGAPVAAQAQAAAAGSAAAAAPVAAPGLAPGGAVVDAGPAEAQVRLAHNQAQSRARRERLMLASAYGQDDEPLPIVTWGAAALLFGAGTVVARRRDDRAARIR